MGHLSIATIIALVDVVTGGSGGFQAKPRVGKYRSGPELEHFLGAAGIELHIGASSRTPSVRQVLTQANSQPEGMASLRKLIEQVVDFREYLECPEKLQEVVGYLNERLRADGFELRQVGDKYKLLSIVTDSAITTALAEKAEALDLDSVKQDFDRAMEKIGDDPEDALTSACSTVESVCKCLLDELGAPYPDKQDISSLAKQVLKHLDLSPERTDIDPDLRRMVNGLSNVIAGIGALRTHAGDAHGRGKSTSRIEGRIARLAIHAASTVSMFLLETWEKQQRG